VDRRLLPVAACWFAALVACADRRPARPGAEGGDAAVAAASAEPARREAPLEPDATIDPPAEPIAPSDVLSGAAAEQVIAETVSPPREAPPPDAPELRVTPTGIGKLAIGMSRREVLTVLGRRGFLRKVWTPPGEVGVEVGEQRLADGTPLLRLRIYGGRLTEIALLARDARARTDADIMVGSTFDEAVLAHGDPRRTPRGFVLEDLPGVVFVPEADAAGLAAPPPAARIVGMIVVGPESD
jgi:hypothetical protein